MKKIGIIGGVGPESSIEYYRLIIKRFQQKLETKDYPELIINSINMTEMLNYVFTNQLDKLVVNRQQKVQISLKTYILNVEVEELMKIKIFG
jgi:aspartate racemase